MAVGGQDLICVKQKPSSTISPADLRGYLDDLGDSLFSDGRSPSLIERKTRDGRQKVMFFILLISLILELLCIFFLRILDSLLGSRCVQPNVAATYNAIH